MRYRYKSRQPIPLLRLAKRSRSQSQPASSASWNQDVFEIIRGLSLRKHSSLRACRVLITQHLPSCLSQDIWCNEALLCQLLGGINEDEYHRLIAHFGKAIFYMDGMALLSLGNPFETQTFVDGMNALLSDGFLADLSSEMVIQGADINIYWPKIHRAALTAGKEIIGYALYQIAAEAKATVLSGEWKEINAFYCSKSSEMAEDILLNSRHFFGRVLAAAEGNAPFYVMLVNTNHHNI
ncbi:hypothetical protein TWF718_005771 [Orbilia javanica]|uniref:Uncharacterized protein n=1 Tax=Orbilia javanica TaxID=47235 RepID=A0AAN8REF7_9PEZI